VTKKKYVTILVVKATKNYHWHSSQLSWSVHLREKGDVKKDTSLLFYRSYYSRIKFYDTELGAFPSGACLIAVMRVSSGRLVRLSARDKRSSLFVHLSSDKEKKILKYLP
jgi:hypothetical protein